MDWQVPRYSSPVTDIVYFLFCCTSKELRDKHFDSLIKLYHSTLTDLLERFVIILSTNILNIYVINDFFRLGCNPDRLFPFEALQEQFKNFGLLAVCMSALMIPLLTTNQVDLPDLDDITKDNLLHELKDPLENPECMERMRGVMDDMIRLGFI